MTVADTATSTEPEHLRAFTQTGPVSITGLSNSSTGAGSGGTRAGGTGFGGTGYGGVSQDMPTGTLPVIPREQINESQKVHRQALRRQHVPFFLRLCTWLTFVLLVVAGVGIGIQRWRPELLAQWGVAHIIQPAGVPTAVPVTKPTAQTSTEYVNLASTDGLTTATYTVNVKSFSVVITTTAPCYVQVTSPASGNPIASYVQSPNVRRSYAGSGSLTVLVGASGVTVAVSIDGETRFTTAPQHAPFTYTFNSAAGS